MAVEETKILASTAMIFGTVSIVLLVSPFLLYAAKFNDQQKRADGLLKNVGDVVFLHVAMFVLAIIMTGAINGIMIKPDFKPENAISFFYGYGASLPWEYWFNRGTSSFGSLSAKDQEFMQAFVVAMNYYMLFVFIIYLVIPIAILWNAFSAYTSENQLREYAGGQNIGWQDYFGHAKAIVVRFIGTVALVLFHMEMASVYVSVFIGSSFSHYSIMSKLWHTILVG